MAYYIGLDVSQKTTAICIIDDAGKVVVQGSALSRPSDIYGWIGNRVAVPEIAKVGLESAGISAWLYTGLTKAGLPVLCLEAFQAHRFLATQRNKTDKNDARGLAQLVRMGGEDFLKLVTVRSQTSQEARALLVMRQHLVEHKVNLENHISGILKPFGLLVERGNVSPAIFRDRVIEAICLAEDRGVNMREIILPSLNLYKNSCEQLALLQKQVEVLATSNPICQRFMTIPGVGPVVALSFYTAVDYPGRFKKSADVGAYFGLTPRQFQSGEADYTLGISKRGDNMVRRHLVTAATSLLMHSKKWSPLKAWGVKLAQRQGLSKARVAVARKLAIIMHKMWINNQDFHWELPPEKYHGLEARAHSL